MSAIRVYIKKVSEHLLSPAINSRPESSRTLKRPKKRILACFKHLCPGARSALLMIVFTCLLSIASVLTGNAYANNASAIHSSVNLKQPADTVIVPDNFLRRWDPVTVFFAKDTGTPGPENEPERVISMSPQHPGVFYWLDERTLQFRPAEPWPPLTRFSWTFEGQTRDLDTLMSPPMTSLPTDNASDLDPVESIMLTFPEPLEAEALEEMIAIELRPLPGVGKGEARWLDKDDFDLKVQERKSRDDSASYIVILHEPIPMGTKSIVHLRLSLSDQIEQAFHRIEFSTGEPFRITHFGGSRQMYPVTRTGVSYAKEQAIQGRADNRTLQVQFSSEPADLNVIAARNMVRISPAVEELSFNSAGNRLLIDGRFQSGTLYQLTLDPIALRDTKGRELQMDGPSSLYVHFPPKEDYLSWKKAYGIMERYGPQMLPVEGRGFVRMDLRIYPLDPLNRTFWPFPKKSVSVNEDATPPAPGEDPAPFDDTCRYISADELSSQIKALGSPAVSELLELPLRKEGNSASFGIDLTSQFERIHGRQAPGHYLVGMRKLDSSAGRNWVRVQVTDLSVTIVEEPWRVRFVVTSLSSGMPVSDAEILLEGGNKKCNSWISLFSGRTGADGSLSYRPRESGLSRSVRRIVISKDDDVLVLDPTNPPEQYRDNTWNSIDETWLQWTEEGGRTPLRGEPTRRKIHIFTERPVYRPEEPVHIKGYFRRHSKGQFSNINGKAILLVDGPGDLEWRYDVQLTEFGSFYHKFDEEKLPTGQYRAMLIYKNQQYGEVSFLKEAYRLPRFEVQLHGPDIATLDKAFKVGLTASYYAGGRVADRPVRWRVMQYPYTWVPKKRQGFVYSTDARFSGGGRFESTPERVAESKTGEQGGAEISIDPSIEPSAQPRRYVVEATVTGADDQTVTNTSQVLALPPFTLGLKVPRFIKQAESIDPEIIVVGPEGELLDGHEVKMTLQQRQWHSHLQADDFSQNAARYVTETVDEKIFEDTLVSSSEPQRISVPIEDAGVYIVRLEARDKLGRTQTLSVDLFAGGDEPVTWSRPPTKTFKVTAEKSEYNPGETATLILESPFQSAHALAIVEPPDEQISYQWIDIRNGAATFEFPLMKEYMPKIPVHFVLMKGRSRNGKSLSAGSPDLGKPVTMAATTWVTVTPAAHQVYMELEYPSKAQPGDEIEITVKIADEQEQPISGEVTLWLVDQAVLALGKEQRLDPLPDFIVNRGSHVTLRDTRNLTLGHFPFLENPGGDGGDEGKNLLDKVTIRENFQPVPYYNPALLVGDDGTVTVKVKLPDNLTNFKLRAKAVSGPDRFGYAKGHLAVRLPVIVQPSLPRFVRPGDRFSATAIGRVVEGDGGPGASSIHVQGLQLEGEADQTFDWQPNRPQRIEYDVSVMTPEYTDQGVLADDSVKVILGVERTADKARDAFSVTLPIRPDRKAIVQRQLLELVHNTPIELPPIKETVRHGTLKRSLLISGQGALVRMAAGLDYLMNYPHGCTEQRISQARVQLAAKRFRDVLYQQSGEDRLELIVNQTLEWIERTVNDSGLVSFWPGSQGYVSLTAWVVQFMVEARSAGFQVEQDTLDTLIASLKRSLRSDYAYYINGENWAERCWALTALADAGHVDRSYAAELARKSEFLSLESKAQVALALERSGWEDSEAREALEGELWNGLVIRLYQGKEIYGGLQESAGSRNALILPSETRTVSEIVRAFSKTQAGDAAHLQLLVDALVTLGRDDGWGSTNANSSAMLALAEYLKEHPATHEPRRLTVENDSESQQLTLEKGMRYVVTKKPDALRVSVDEEGKPLTLRSETSYLPEADGSTVESHAQGFVVSRELLKIGADGAPPQHIPLESAGATIEFEVGDIIEEHIEVVNPEERHYVAVAIPLAAGIESLNPALETAPPEAKPSGRLTLEPSYVAFMDDQMAFYYDTLPKGTYHFYFRAKAVIPGSFIQPAAYAEMMYDQAVNGQSNGAKIEISKVEEGQQ